ncbi:DHA2 family multidrug resistance protein-like MFS transporter [Saccharothrix carnea]|uniref:DHA2 family multidrug resistance protein-like MFS transporter n=1 Tax=Saccharothrix carnea TaxID=1280637 RepID=A0A2P8HR22_SACCR|nr:MFS transporter [Saccharothrix carnea]PSL48634.1 DHA2 family multidrug resistance protein-like MFS transporter [Saccharothrix carnea]
MSETVSGGTAVRAGAKEWLGLAVLALPTLVLAVDVTVLFLALPHIGADLQPSSAQTLWIMDSYAFLVAGFLITMGTLGDRIGRRKLLMIGALAFGAASIIAAYAPSAELLIAARALLGVAGATLMPSTLALISNMFRDEKQLGLAIGIWTSVFSAGLALGPLVGGLLLEWFWWGSVFLLGAVVMVVLLVVGPMLLPEYKDTEAGRLDLVSVALSLATIIPVIYGIKDMATNGVDLVPVAVLVAGVVFGVVFVLRQRGMADPMLDLKLFRNRSFTVALSVMLLSLVATGGVYLIIAQYLQLVEGLTPLRAGLALLPAAIVMVISSVLAPGLAQRFGPGLVIGVGQLIAAVGYVLVSLVEPAGGLGFVVVGLAVLYFGGGPMMALGTGIIVGSAPPEKAGSAASVSETGTELGVALGVAILGSVGAAVYQGRMDDVNPAGVPAEALADAQDSLDKATAAAAGLPEQLGNAVLEPAKEALTGSLTVVAGIGAAMVAILGVLIMVTLRKNRDAPESDANADPQPADASSLDPTPGVPEPGRAG